MSSKIEGTTPASPLRGPDSVSPRPETVLRPAPPAEDTVDLTDEARLMQRLENMLGSIPATDRARVDALRLALTSGAYEIDPQRIAARIVRLERDLLGMP
jgi:negative regulator of flagellin synthesis FlgM